MIPTPPGPAIPTPGSGDIPTSPERPRPVWVDRPRPEKERGPLEEVWRALRRLEARVEALENQVARLEGFLHSP